MPKLDWFACSATWPRSALLRCTFSTEALPPNGFLLSFVELLPAVMSSKSRCHKSRLCSEEVEKADRDNRNEIRETTDQERGHGGLRDLFISSCGGRSFSSFPAHRFRHGQTTGSSFLNPNPAYQSPLQSSNRMASIVRTASLDR